LGLVLVLDLLGSHHLDVVGVLWGLGAAVGLAVYFVVSAEAKEGPAPLVMAWGGLATGTVVLGLAAAIGVMPVAAPRRDVVLAHHHVSWLVPVLGIALVAAVVAGRTANAQTMTSPAKLAAAAYNRMTPHQRIGQLFMVGASDYKSTSNARAVMTRYYVGNAIFIGLTHAGADAVADHIRPVRTTTMQAGVDPFIAVDQEGGEVQHLQGPGFWTMPT